MSSYDVELERTDEQPKSRYLTKKDAIRIVLGVLVLLILLYPVYVLLLKRAQKSICATNLKQISTAIGLYSEENGSRLPPTYVTYENLTPLVEKGGAYTWVNLVDGYVKDLKYFTCPSAEASEGVMVKTSSGGLVRLTYGMYAPLGGEPIDQVDNPDQAVLLGETSNMGQRRTYDPSPFKLASGSVVPYDGFLIGFNDSNQLPTDETRFVTRLAYYGTEGGIFKDGGDSRHCCIPIERSDSRTENVDVIHVLTVDGRSRALPPSAAVFKDNPLWKIPKTRQFR